ncbi:WH1 domain-containing protein [Caerostris darwini]|uniref:WH1 domain-containing protein n=2 Tax=Caerostris TaxID=172845 RepID=A0AAV4RVP9_9ARAC|nr:WH1 domain-containing protein [Caerostris darwini]GIY35988.1 WH1 domain-containing protein [Caerostris extrusa]
MDHYGSKTNTIYHSFQNGNVNNIYEEKPEQIYCDPEIVVKNSNNEKHAVKLIMEKYDSLRCLNNQIDNLQISSDSGDSIAKESFDDSNSGPPDDLNGDYDEDNSVFENGELSEQDILQVEVFFRSHKTYVSVCHCLANLYFATSDGSEKKNEWELARTGIPVILLDKGETRARNKRMLQIVLAEKGSGFVLWKDVIDNLSNYKAEESNTFHTMYLSSDHRKMAGLSFDCPEAAEKFLKEIEQLTSDPLNICLSVPKQKKKSLKSPKKKEKMKQPRKCDISTPCCFEHVTRVALDDKKKLFSMATLVPSGEKVKS